VASKRTKAGKYRAGINISQKYKKGRLKKIHALFNGQEVRKDRLILSGYIPKQNFVP